MREINITEVLNRIEYGQNPIQALGYIVEEMNRIIYAHNDLVFEVEELKKELLAYKSFS